jgi:xanthine dehydrogenase small subunit
VKNTTRNHLIVFVNGKEHRIAGGEALGPLSTFLRRRLRLVGTKLACFQGQCGACSVLVGRKEPGAPDRLTYRPIDACITPLFQLDRAHVVTVEGIGSVDELSPVQRVLVDGHGSQCGYCTPGMVIALTGLFEASDFRAPPDEEALKEAISGNLCRCTGYLQILRAAGRLRSAEVPRIRDRHPDGPILRAFASAEDEAARIEAGDSVAPRTLHLPRTLDAAVALRQRYPGALIVGGATALAGSWTSAVAGRSDLISLRSVAGIDGAELCDERLLCGGMATWARIREVLRGRQPVLHAHLGRLGCPQVRSEGTVAGQVIEASASSDALPWLIVSEADLELIGSTGMRRVAIGGFYDSRGRPRLGTDELVARIEVPLPRSDERLALYKISRRRQLDVASLGAAILLRLERGRIRAARVALSGVGPPVQSLPATEAFLRDRAFAEDVMRRAGEIAKGEIHPASDVGGSAAYRGELAANVFVKAYHDLQASHDPGGLAE